MPRLTPLFPSSHAVANPVITSRCDAMGSLRHCIIQRALGNGQALKGTDPFTQHRFHELSAQIQPVLSPHSFAPHIGLMQWVFSNQSDKNSYNEILGEIQKNAAIDFISNGTKISVLPAKYLPFASIAVFYHLLFSPYHSNDMAAFARTMYDLFPDMISLFSIMRDGSGIVAGNASHYPYHNSPHYCEMKAFKATSSSDKYPMSDLAMSIYLKLGRHDRIMHATSLLTGSLLSDPCIVQYRTSVFSYYQSSLQRSLDALATLATTNGYSSYAMWDILMTDLYSQFLSDGLVENANYLDYVHRYASENLD